MARILVADDNSNIQKMVSATLKDQGIDVVAVGNGEAAVRKISDLRPDLVLADVFMPVRNGYEVCEFVKTDSKLAHIPVILLVGAFDPLDEQEAQRVGADGVLKKPFVPADPLISMVKSALTRAGVATMMQAPSPPLPSAHNIPSYAQPKAARNTEPRKELPHLHELGTVPLPKVVHDAADEGFAPRVKQEPPPVTIPEGSHPVAFGNLLRTTGASGKTSEEPDPDPDTLVARHPELDAKRAWNAPRNQDAVDEEAAEESTEPSWRRDGGEEIDTGSEEVAQEKKDWRSALLASIMEKKHELGKQPPKPEATEPADSASREMDSEPKPTTATGMPSRDAWSSALSTGAPRATHFPGERAASEQARTLKATEPEAAEEAIEITQSGPTEKESSSPKPEEKSSKTPSWFTTQASPWDAEAQKVSELAAATWNVPQAAASSIQEAVKSVKAEEFSIPVQAVEEPVVHTGNEDLPFAYEPEPLTIGAEAGPAATPTPTRVPAKTVQPKAGQSQQDLEALVARVLERINPDVLQQVTRELLKPVVEAIVRGELEAKK